MRDDAAYASRRQNRPLPSEHLQSAASLKRTIATAEIRPHVDIHDMATHLPLPHFKMPTSSIELLAHCRSIASRGAAAHYDDTGVGHAQTHTHELQQRGTLLQHASHSSSCRTHIVPLSVLKFASLSRPINLTFPQFLLSTISFPLSLSVSPAFS